MKNGNLVKEGQKLLAILKNQVQNSDFKNWINA